VLAPAAAKQWLQQQITSRTASPTSHPVACGSGRLIFAGPGAAVVWRLHDLPHELAAGTFTAPVRWLAEQAADPQATFVQFTRTRAPRLTVNRSKAPRGSHEILEDALTILRSAPGLALAVKGRPRAAGPTAHAAFVPPPRSHPAPPTPGAARRPEPRQNRTPVATPGARITAATPFPAPAGVLTGLLQRLKALGRRHP
jgi:hypothetical protein